MQISVLQGLLIGVVAAFTCIEGDFMGECKLREPLVTGFLVGLILGDPVLLVEIKKLFKRKHND